MLPKATEWAEFNANMLRRTGLDLNDYKANQLQRRIIGMMEARQAKNLNEFWNLISKDAEGLTWFKDKLAINVSELFRNADKWKQLEAQVIPTLLKTTSKLKIWSAGCSYGAEAHSLACVLHKKFAGPHQVVGTDIDKAALDQAKRGEFGESDMRNVPNEYREYFLREGASWFARPEIKKYLSFRDQNLLESRIETGFDLICCRNVVIYFTEDAKDKLYQRFFTALKPGGILFVGSTERISNASELGFEHPIPFFYQKPKQEAKTWRNAS